MIDRRKFLERSVLGAGGVLFSSVLLESCTKYGIPFPGKNPHPGPSSGTGLTEAELGIDWNDDVRAAVIAGIGKIPEGGEVVSILLGKLFPGTNSPFDQMKSQIEALIDQKLNQEKYDEVKGILGDVDSGSGLAGLIAKYMKYVKALAVDPSNANKSTVVTQFQVTQAFFIENLKEFQEAGYEVLLLPLFAQYANMYLALLRDGALHGKDWNMDQIIIEGALDDLEKYTVQFTAYVDKHYPDGVTNALAFANNVNLHADDIGRNHHVEPFATTNAYSRQTTFEVLDFRDTWEYYDVRKYPNGKTGADGKPIKESELLNREIYSDPRGTTQVNAYQANGGQIWVPIPLPSPLGGAPSSLPTQIGVWAGQRIDSIQLTYPQGGGPQGITQTPNMGGPGGNTNPDGEVLGNTLSNPITQFRVGTLSTRDVWLPALSLLQFSRYSPNPPLRQYGGKDTKYRTDDWGWVGYPGMAMSSIYIGGKAILRDTDNPDPANCIVVGFKHWDSPTLALRAVRLHYVTSPKEKSMADLVKAFPGVAIPAGLIEEAKAERLAHWARIEASAKKTK